VVAVRNLIDAWSRSDPQGAAAWVRALPGGAAKDKALEQLANTAAAAGDSGAAFKWLTSVEDGKQREQMLHTRYTEWAQTDAAAAKAAVEALPAEAGDRERILNGTGEPVEEMEIVEESEPDPPP
jgi:hypothetical protein